MSFEMPANKSKTEEKQEPTGIVVQVSGSTTSGLNKIKQNEGAPPIEITSKLNGDRSGDGLVSYDNGVTGP